MLFDRQNANIIKSITGLNLKFFSEARILILIQFLKLFFCDNPFFYKRNFKPILMRCLKLKTDLYLKRGSH